MDYIIVEKYSTDYRGEDEFIIGKDTILPDDNYISVGDVSIGNGAYKFYGNILVIENVRNVISIFVWGISSGIAMTIVLIKNRTQKRGCIITEHQRNYTNR